MADRLPTVLVAVPCQLQSGYRPFDVILAQFLHQSRQEPRLAEVEVCYGMTGVVAGARNRLVREALSRGVDYVWWLDDDQPFALGDFDKLFAHQLDAVVPLSPRRGAPFLPLIYDSVSGDWTARQHFLADHESGLIPVAGAGMAGLLIRTECFRAIGEDGWFELVHPPTNFDDYAEDFNFYKKLAAAGVQLYCDLDVRFGHAVTSVAYLVKQQGQWVTVLADTEPFVAFPQVKDPHAPQIALTDRWGLNASDRPLMKRRRRA